jgi:sodium transport system ATP-binding protein
MQDVLIANGLRKTFTLSKKQQAIEKTSIKKRVAVDGLSFAVKKGEIYGLLGPNGAGKTTTLRLLSTLLKTEAGDATVNGYSILKEPDMVRRQIGFLTSELKPDDFFTPSYIFDFYRFFYRFSD